MYQFRVLAKLLQDFVYYHNTQTQQDFIWPAKSIFTNYSPQHSRKTHRESNCRKTSIHSCMQWFYPPESARWSEIQVHLRCWHRSHSKGKSSSTLAFNISRFFLSLNHNLLTHILEKADFDPKVTSFFANYLVSRKTKYMWNDISFPSFDVNVGVGQGSTLSSILSSLYLSPFFYILENRLKNLRIPVSILSFVDDGLIIAQNKSVDISNS